MSDETWESVSLNMDAGQAEWLAGLLTRAVESRTAGHENAAALLARMRVQRDAVRTSHAARMEAATVFADAIEPLLKQAREDGRYVKASDDQTGEVSPRAAFVPLPHGSYRGYGDWVGAELVLRERGLRLQHVWRWRRSGWSSEGFRIADDGDERRNVGVRDVWAQAGRCRRCGARREDTVTPGRPGVGVACIGIGRTHDFGGAQSWSW